MEENSAPSSQKSIQKNTPNPQSFIGIPCKIVVARYNENIDWLIQSSIDQKDLVIYNKGQPLGVENEIPLPNVGRESDTYLQYIISNYDKLPDVVVFTQANIADHKGSNDVNHFVRLIQEACVYGISKPSVVHYHLFQKQVKHNPWQRDWNVNPDGTFYLHDHYKNNRRIVFYEWFKLYIQQPYPNPFHICHNGIFAVRKELIQKHSIYYYQTLLDQINHHSDPAEGHFMERSWYYIFHPSI